MSKKTGVRAVLLAVVLGFASVGGWYAYHSMAGADRKGREEITKARDVDPLRVKPEPTSKAGKLERRFAEELHPFVERYCLSCHGPTKPKGGLDLSCDTTVRAIVKNMEVWGQVLERLEAEEMPPVKAPRHP